MKAERERRPYLEEAEDSFSVELSENQGLWVGKDSMEAAFVYKKGYRTLDGGWRNHRNLAVVSDVGDELIIRKTQEGRNVYKRKAGRDELAGKFHLIYVGASWNLTGIGVSGFNVATTRVGDGMRLDVSAEGSMRYLIVDRADPHRIADSLTEMRRRKN